MNAAERAGGLFATAAVSLGVRAVRHTAQSCLVPCVALAWLLHRQVGVCLSVCLSVCQKKLGWDPVLTKQLWSLGRPLLHTV